MSSAQGLPQVAEQWLHPLLNQPLSVWALALLTLVLTLAALVRPPRHLQQPSALAHHTDRTTSQTYTAVLATAPVPRASLPSEKTYVTNSRDGTPTPAQSLPCWLDRYLARRGPASERGAEAAAADGDDAQDMEPADIFMSVVVPAYNEEDRLAVMLDEAIQHLDAEYGPADSTSILAATTATSSASDGTALKRRTPTVPSTTAGTHPAPTAGWEILLVSDGSTDATAAVALDLAASRRLPPGALRVVTLRRNRGKGGAVTHGLRHVRGAWAVFADADGASRFADLRALLAAARRAVAADADADAPAVVAVGSRAHLVGSDAVVRRSALRNLLMHAFHLLLRLLTPAATSRIRDTQCGFKLLSRAALPHIVPHMHSEGWIFDVEMLMLAEAAGMPMVEVPVGWREVKGSKLNVVWDSLGMAWGLAILRAAWALGVYRV